MQAMRGVPLCTISGYWALAHIFAGGFATSSDPRTATWAVPSGVAPHPRLCDPTTPLPAAVVQVHAEPGASVTRGTPLMVLEAMKMEHVIVAPADGVVASVRYAVGDQVEEGAELIVLGSPDSA